MMNLKGKTVLIAVSGGIAAYKACEIVSQLKKMDAEVIILMTKNATEFVSPLTFETLSQNRVITETFDRNFNWNVQHVSLSKKADIFVVVPATANIIAKINLGIADDMVTTTAMAVTCPILICPAMNTNMYNNINFQQNMEALKNKGYHFISPDSGRLACGDVGMGKLAATTNIMEKIINILQGDLDISIQSLHNISNDYKNKKILITAGATIEDIDGVRYISNYSSGKMGVALAQAAKDRGADVTLIAGNISAIPPEGIEVVKVKSTMDMRNAVIETMHKFDIIIKAAAPADYGVTKKADNKIKTQSLVLNLVKTPDIAKEVGKLKKDKKLVIFCAETTNLIENAKKKITDKNADLIVANDVTKEGAGFNTDTNIATIIDKDGNIEDLPIMTKYSLSNIILDKVLKL